MARGEGGKRFVLGAVGLVGLAAACCTSASGLAYFGQSITEDQARQHAELVLAQLQAHQWDQALRSSSFRGDGGGLYDAAQLERCMSSTVLGDLQRFECIEVDAPILENDADVTCRVQSASWGSTVITVQIKSPETEPHVGFVWFSDPSAMGEAWRSDECRRWSGRESIAAPPPGRVRPSRL